MPRTSLTPFLLLTTALLAGSASAQTGVEASLHEGCGDASDPACAAPRLHVQATAEVEASLDAGTPRVCPRTFGLCVEETSRTQVASDPVVADVWTPGLSEAA